MLLFTPLSYLGFGIALPFLLSRNKVRHGIKVRLGIYPKEIGQKKANFRRIWVHGASAGDILALVPTVRALKEKVANLDVVATTWTDSGHRLARAYPDLFKAVYFCPYDLPGATRRAMAHIAPCALVLEYTELWPQLIYAAKEAKVPVLLHNGRFARQNLGGYRLLFYMTGNLLRLLKCLMMRDEQEAARAVSLGAQTSSIFVTGNTKFDNAEEIKRASAKSKTSVLFPFSSDRLVWVAGSTHQGEEHQLLLIFKRLKQKHSTLGLILAPRYPNRGAALARLARDLHFETAQRSKPADSLRKCDVFILDSIGELSHAYRRAACAFVGGSFVNRGGQNILEPAALGTPVIFGPDMKNFLTPVAILKGQGCIQVASFEELERETYALLADPKKCAEFGRLAQQASSTLSGAARKNAQIIYDTIMHQASVGEEAHFLPPDGAAKPSAT